jgi:hypothetical protein
MTNEPKNKPENGRKLLKKKVLIQFAAPRLPAKRLKSQGVTRIPETEGTGDGSILDSTHLRRSRRRIAVTGALRHTRRSAASEDWY